jgi:hypothetical protein
MSCDVNNQETQLHVRAAGPEDRKKLPEDKKCTRPWDPSIVATYVCLNIIHVAERTLLVVSHCELHRELSADAELGI